MIILSIFFLVVYIPLKTKFKMNDTVIPFLSFSVLELHQNPAAQPPPKKMNTKFDHLVLGPAAGQGLPNRLQCQGSYNLI